MTQKNYTTAINEALHLAMQIDESVICYGLGVTDPKAVFGTTEKLEARFGSKRVFDMPTSENAMTGVAIGAALNGIKSVVTHQRIDFFLFSYGSTCQWCSKMALHVWGAKFSTYYYSFNYRAWLGPRAHALAKPSSLVCPYSWAKGSHANNT